MSNGSKEMTIYKKSCTGITMEEIERWFADEIKIAKLQRNKKAQVDLKKQLGKIRRNEKSHHSSLNSSQFTSFANSPIIHHSEKETWGLDLLTDRLVRRN